MEEVYHILRLLEKILELLGKKAKWKALNPKTRKLCSRLFVYFLYSLVVMLVCGVAVSSEAPHVEIFQALGLSATMAFITLGFLAISVNLVGVIISRAERYQSSNPIRQKLMKRLFFSRSITVRAVSYRAGHARSHRRASRSAFSNAALKDSSDGESDSGDPPARPLPSVVVPALTFPNSFYEPNSFPSPWRFLRSLGCWRMFFGLPFTGRRWGI
jgi:hypothetical protein